MNTSESAAARNGVTAIVLAGGRSSRFGSDKAGAVLLDRPLLEWVLAAVSPACSAIVVVKARGQQLPHISGFDFAEVEDIYDARGPLAAIVTGFDRCQTDRAFVVACDTPGLVPGLVQLLIERIAGFDLALPIVETRRQPLCALYTVSACREAFRQAVDEGRLAVIAACNERRAIEVREEELRRVDPDLRSFRNVNTPELLVELAGLLATSKDSG